MVVDQSPLAHDLFLQTYLPLKCSSVILSIFEYWHILTKFKCLPSAHLFCIFLNILKCPLLLIQQSGVLRSNISKQRWLSIRCSLPSAWLLFAFAKIGQKAFCFPSQVIACFLHSTDSFCQDRPKTSHRYLDPAVTGTSLEINVSGEPSVSGRFWPFALWLLFAEISGKPPFRLQSISTDF